MAKMTHNSTANRWELLHTINQAYPSTPKEFVLNTENKFLDQNIYVGITVPNHVGTFTNQSTVTDGSAVANNLTYTSGMNIISSPSGTEGTNYWKITGTATGNAGSFTPKYNVTTAGWIAAQAYTGSATSVSVSSDSTGKSIYIPAAVATVSGSKAAATPSITAGATVSGKTQLTFSLDTNTNNISTYYVTLKAVAGATTFANSNMTYSVGTKGYLNAESQISLSSLATTASNKQYYLPIPSAVITTGGSTANVTINDTDGSAQGINIQGVITHTADTREPSSGYYFAVDYSGSGYSSVSTAGWVPTGALSASGTSSTSGTKYFKVGAATPSASYTNTYISTYFTSGTSSDYDMSITPKYAVGVAGYIPATTGVSGTTDYWKIKTTSLTKGNGSVSLTTGTGDSADSTNPSIAMATTTPSSGVYYTLTATGSGAVSIANAGWISAINSFSSNTATTYGYITKSVAGSAISGSVPTVPSTAIGIEIQPKGYIIIPAGYYPKDRYVYANTADDAGEAEAASGFTLEVGSISGNSAVTVGSLSGGYYTLTANNLSVTATLKANPHGWFSQGSATDSDIDGVTIGKIAAGSCTIAGGVLSTSGFSKTDLALTLSSGSSTNMANITLGAQDTSNYPYYFKVNGSTPAVSGNTTASVTAITDAHTAGYIPAKSATNWKAAQSASPTVSVNDTSNSTYVSLKGAAFTFSAGGTSCTPNENITVADNDNDYNNGLSIVSGGTAITYTNTAGYVPAHISAQTTSGTPGSTTKYLKGVKLTTPSSGKRCFDITVPNGSSSDFITFHFEVDSNSNVTVTDTHS